MICGCEYQAAAITNVTQDHLDFHGDMESYLASKKLLFSRYLASDGTAVVNLDDANAAQFIDTARARGARLIRVTRKLELDAEVKLLSADIALSGSRVQVELPSGTRDFELPLVGDFNLENLLVACGICIALEISPEIIAEGVAACPQVPGRMEIVGAEMENVPTVIVDYAHTPDAVEKLLSAVRPLSTGRLITVFGCGGDRDRAKRPLMAEAVARHSDRTIATSDNPRTEDPLALLNDVEKGLGELERVKLVALDGRDRSYAVVPDRREVIPRAAPDFQPRRLEVGVPADYRPPGRSLPGQPTRAVTPSIQPRGCRGRSPRFFRVGGWVPSKMHRAAQPRPRRAKGYACTQRTKPSVSTRFTRPVSSSTTRCESVSPSAERFEKMLKSSNGPVFQCTRDETSLAVAVVSLIAWCTSSSRSSWKSTS